jgi:hypothetical protein
MSFASTTSRCALLNKRSYIDVSCGIVTVFGDEGGGEAAFMMPDSAAAELRVFLGVIFLVRSSLIQYPNSTGTKNKKKNSSQPDFSLIQSLFGRHSSDDYHILCKPRITTSSFSLTRLRRLIFSSSGEWGRKLGSINFMLLELLFHNSNCSDLVFMKVWAGDEVLFSCQYK